MVKTSAHAKGDRTEREAVHLIEGLLGLEVRRTKAGHKSDWGDISHVPATTIQVKGYANVADGLREGLAGLALQQASARTVFAALFLRLPRAKFVVAMRPEQFATLWSAAQHGLAYGWSPDTNDGGIVP